MLNCELCNLFNIDKVQKGFVDLLDKIDDKLVIEKDKINKQKLLSIKKDLEVAREFYIEVKTMIDT